MINLDGESRFRFEMSMKKMTPTVDYPDNSFKTLHHINLKTTISSLYGRETWKNFHLMENLRIKIIKRVVDLD
jgi:hypothetical protein